MPRPPGATPASADHGSDLSYRYALVIVIEVIVIAALYWLGRHFA